MDQQTTAQHQPADASSTQRPRRFGAAAMIATLVVGAAGGGAAVHFLGRGAAPAHGEHAAAAGAADAKPVAKKKQYTCPMHPTVVQDHPGDCPICGMALVPLDAGDATESGAAGGAHGERKIAFYRSPMDPKQTSPTPRKDEMGMDYVPVYEDEVSGGGAAKVDGLATVSIDPQRQQLIGLRTAEVTRGAVGGSWRTNGRVAVDETRVRHVNVKVGGFVEKVFVDFTGKFVARGQPLFTMYSPEVVSAENEYLLAKRTQEALQSGGMVRASGEDLVSSARRRLEYWDVPPSVIAQLDRTGKPSRTITLVSPISGVVTKKELVEGARIEEGAMPYEIVDLSTVWVLADVYEAELGKVKIGMPATLTLQAFPNRTFQGKVVFLDPLLDKSTRTAKVRLAFPNPKGDLRPEMFGEVVLQSGRRQGLRVPADAVVRSGTRDVVFVALDEGKFQPREVQLGATDGDAVEVVSGLREGERVVTRANFLIDSESRLKASLAAMGGK